MKCINLLMIFLGISVPACAAPANRIDTAMASAIAYLCELQNPEGAISNRSGNETALTSLAILSFAAMGHQPSDPGREGDVMRRALDYILRPERQESDGYFGYKDGSRMYGHGITVLMLAEMLGMGADAKQDALILEKCRKGISLIIRAQKMPKQENHRGGWRYTPDTGDSDMSVTVWQTMALRAAKNAGLEVPKDSIDRAMMFIKRCYERDPAKEGAVKSGGFGYQGRGRDLSTTAEGILALQVCGDYESEEVRGAAERLLREGLRPSEKWFYYLTYYYAQGMYQRGGKYAEEAARSVADALIPTQASDGSWEAKAGEERGGGRVYATTLSILSLSVKNHFLPIYQR